MQKSDPARPSRPKLRPSNSVLQFVKEINEDETKVAKELFQIADRDSDGCISRSELRNIMIEMGVQASEEEFQLLFDAIDLNGDGKISLQEWLNGMHWLKKSMRIQDAPESAPAAAASTKPRLERKKSLAEFSAEVSKEDAGRICELFKMIDKNSNGKITRKELLQVLQESGVEATPQDADKLLEQLDTDHDGVISFLEFQQGIRQLGRALELSNKLARAGGGQEQLLLRYIRENLLERGLRKAQEALDRNQPMEARVLLELVDVPRLQKLEEFTGTGSVLSQASLDTFQALREQVRQRLRL